MSYVVFGTMFWLNVTHSTYIWPSNQDKWNSQLPQWSSDVVQNGQKEEKRNAKRFCLGIQMKKVWGGFSWNCMLMLWNHVLQRQFFTLPIICIYSTLSLVANINFHRFKQNGLGSNIGILTTILLHALFPFRIFIWYKNCKKQEQMNINKELC